MRIMMPTSPIHLLPVKCRRSLSLLYSPAALSPFKASPCYCSGTRRLHSGSRSFFGSSSAPLHGRNAQAKTYGSLAVLLPFRSTIIVEYLDGNLQLCVFFAQIYFAVRILRPRAFFQHLKHAQPRS
ncbi:hypothetical protein B0H13DRAFT_2272212 [Mycena leptocephala]|nr:hypothetical protein B0H13DRAFT_2272212 [Mycena leptocephala]